MAGLEVLGGIASAAQICTYIAKGVSTLRAIQVELRSAPDRIRQQTHCLSLLIDILQFLEDDYLLETLPIHAHIQQIYEKAGELGSILTKNARRLKCTSSKRVLNAWRVLRKEQHILRTLSALEQDKSSLLLAISAYGIKVQGLCCAIGSDRMCGCWPRISLSRSSRLSMRSNPPTNLPNSGARRSPAATAQEGSPIEMPNPPPGPNANSGGAGDARQNGTNQQSANGASRSGAQNITNEANQNHGENSYFSSEAIGGGSINNRHNVNTGKGSHFKSNTGPSK
ncbi:MAG: hypothetical protein M1820_004252 [Bogoriella megaspora]|nr:MAG: hypothetical protein M1820_004252 [Bogoriella megaspora]